MEFINRQVIAVFGVGVAVALVGMVAYFLAAGERALTVAEREKAVAEMEAEHGVAARPGEDRDKRAARLNARLEQDFIDKKLKIYRQELSVRGYILDPSSEEEEFLRAHKSELPNLVIKKSQPAIDVELIGWPLKDYMTVESCDLKGTLLRCLVKLKGGYPLKGWRIRAKSSRWEGAQFIDLGGTSVIAPELMGEGRSELQILLPGRVDVVILSYR